MRLDSLFTMVLERCRGFVRVLCVLYSVDRIRSSEGRTDDRHRSAPCRKKKRIEKNKTGRIQSTGQSPDPTSSMPCRALIDLVPKSPRISVAGRWWWWPQEEGAPRRHRRPPDRPLATEWAAAEIRDGGAFTSWRAVAASGADVATGHGRRRGAREQSLAGSSRTVDSGWHGVSRCRSGVRQLDESAPESGQSASSSRGRHGAITK